jgi:ketosteroid isomerase-like protein
VRQLMRVMPLLALGVAGCSSPRTDTAPSPATVQTEVRQALDKFSDVSGRGDVALFMSQFDSVADIMMIGTSKEQVFKGRAAIEQWLTPLLPTKHISFQMDRVDISSHGETAWAFVEGSETVRDETGKVLASDPYRFTAVLVKQGDRWVWRLFHGSTPEKT